MAHGHEDFHRRTEVFITADDIDLNELAVRLGSIVNFDRLGRVIFANGFEGSLGAFAPNKYGVGSISEKTEDSVKNGAYGVQLTTGAVNNALAGMSRYQPIPFHPRVGFEISFTFNKDFQRYWFILNHHTGLHRYLYNVQLEYFYDSVLKVMQIYTPDGWVAITPTPRFRESVRLFHTLKMVVDFDMKKYAHLLINNISYDLSAYTPWWLGDETVHPYIHAQIQVDGSASGAETCYIDDFILTDSEP